VKINEKHYAPWVQARQNQLESDLTRAWRNDPVAQAETLRSDTAGRQRPANGSDISATRKRYGP
jgi:hypothetical protein